MTGKQLYDEYLQLRAANAVLKARLSLSKPKRSIPDPRHPGEDAAAGAEGVMLTTVPIKKITLGRLARGNPGDTTRLDFCEVPFVLQKDQWFEEVPTLALKDTTAIRDRPDTTGTLTRQIRNASILALLEFERNLVSRSMATFPCRPVERWKGEVRACGAHSGLERRRRSCGVRKRSILIYSIWSRRQVRSFAPNLTAGTKLVLRSRLTPSSD